MLPVTSLIEPSDDLLVRDKNSQHIQALKKEIQCNPTTDVQPMVCIVRKKEGEKYDPKLKKVIFMKQLVVIIPVRPTNNSCLKTLI